MKTQDGKKKGKLVPLAILAVVVLGGAGAWWWYSNRSGAEAAAAPQAATAPVVKGAINISVQAVSVAEPIAQASLRNRTAGTIASALKEGAPVTAGMVVVAMDDTELRKAVSQSELNLKQSQVNLERARTTEAKAKTDLETKRTLLASKAATQEQVDSAQDAVVNAAYALQAAQLSVDQANLALSQAQRDLNDAKLKSPFNGVVSKMAVAIGDFVPANTQVATLVDVGNLLFRAEVDEFDIGKLKEGLAVTVRVPALQDASFRAKVERISPTAEVVNNISIFKVSVVVDNKDGLLRPGMSADVTVLISNEKGLVVPSKAVTTVRDRSYVDIITAEGVQETVRVTIGSTDGRNTLVSEGLEEGMAVVLPGTAVPAAAPAAAAGSAGTSIIPISVPGTGQK